MARRGGSNVSDFLTNFNAAYGLGRRLSQDWETKKINDAQANEFEEFDGEQVDVMANVANAKDEHGNPYYKLEGLDDGTGYKLSMRGEDGEYQPVAGADFKPKKYTEFLGERHEGSLSKEQIERQRRLGIANVMTKYDPEGGRRYLEALKAGDRADYDHERKVLGDQRADQDFEDAKNLQTALQTAYGQTNHGRAMNDYANQMKERERLIAAGTDPNTLPVPELLMPSPTQALQDAVMLQSVRAQHGQADPVAMEQIGRAWRDMQQKDYAGAMDMLQSGVDLGSVLQRFGAGLKIDPASVVSDQMEARADGLQSRVIKYRDPKTGGVLTLDVLGEQAALGNLGQIMRSAQQQRVSNARVAQIDRQSRGGSTQAAGSFQGGLVESVQNLLTNFNKEAASTSKLDPQQLAQASLYGERFAVLNPDANPRAIASLAMRAAAGGGDIGDSSLALDLNAGGIVRAMQDGGGQGGRLVVERLAPQQLTRSERKQLAANHLPELASAMGVDMKGLREMVGDRGRRDALLSSWVDRRAEARASQLGLDISSLSDEDRQNLEVAKQEWAKHGGKLLGLAEFLMQ